MVILSKILIAFIALEHLYILYIEMFAWETKGAKVFKGSLAKDLFKSTKVLAANQGLYNGFLAGGLIWTFFIENIEWNKNISLFFLSCIAIAGIYGAFTVNKRIFFLQALPAILTILILIINC